MTKVYIVVRQDFETGSSIFCSVFFKRALAEAWIKGRRDPDEYRIETYAKDDDGSARKIY